MAFIHTKKTHKSDPTHGPTSDSPFVYYKRKSKPRNRKTYVIDPETKELVEISKADPRRKSKKQSFLIRR